MNEPPLPLKTGSGGRYERPPDLSTWAPELASVFGNDHAGREAIVQADRGDEPLLGNIDRKRGADRAGRNGEPLGAHVVVIGLRTNCPVLRERKFRTEADGPAEPGLGLALAAIG